MRVLDDTESVPPSRATGVWDRDWQRPLVVLLTFLAAAATLWVVWQVITPILRTIITFLLAGVLTFVVAAPVDRFEQWFRNRVLAIAVVYLILAGVLIGSIIVLAGPFVVQATTLAADLPRYMAELQRRTPEIEQSLVPYGIRVDLNQIQSRLLSNVDQAGVGILTYLVGTLGEFGGVLVDIVLALVISFYLLLDGPRIRSSIFNLVPARHQGKAHFFEENAARVLGGYLRGQVITAVAMGLLAGAGVAVFGLPYAVVLGVMAGLFAFVPMFGPILSAVPAVLVAAFQPFPTVIWVLIYFVGISQVVTNIIGPRVTGHAVGLHPLAAMFALLAGFQMVGFLGGLFAVPLVGIVWVLILATYRNAWPAPTATSGGIVGRLRRRTIVSSGRPEPPHPREG